MSFVLFLAGCVGVGPEPSSAAALPGGAQANVVVEGGPFVPSGKPGRFRESLDANVFYKGNLHTHSTESDGDSPPQDVYAWYRDHGYSFLALSDHNKLTDPSDYSEVLRPGFIMLPAEEITTKPEGKPVHVNGICTKSRIGGGRFATIGDSLHRAVSEIHAQGGVALINHPNFEWAFGAEALAYARGAELLEIWSGHPNVHTQGDATHPSHEAIWDAALTGGMDIAGVAVDDMHKLGAPPGAPKAGPGRGWVDVFASELSAAAICDGLRRGHLVASNGVRLARLRVVADSMAITVNAPATVEFIGRGGALLDRRAASPTEEVVYRLQGSEGYVRARVTDGQGKQAWTQAYRTVEAR